MSHFFAHNQNQEEYQVARSFVQHLPNFSSLQDREKEKYLSVTKKMGDDYKLPRGQADVLAAELGCSSAVVLLTARVIHRLYRLYQGDTAAERETLARAGRDDFEALKSVSFWDRNISWIDLESLMDDEEIARRIDMGDVSESTEETIRRMTARISELETENARLHEVLRRLRAHLEEDQEADGGESVGSNHMSPIERHRQFILDTGLPETAKVFNRDEAPVQYSGAFQKTYLALGSREQRGVLDAVSLLAEVGSRRSKSQLDHKPFPRKRGVMPKGCMISTPGRSRSIRFAWSYTAENVLLLRFVGTHDKFWDSEG